MGIRTLIYLLVLFILLIFSGATLINFINSFLGDEDNKNNTNDGLLSIITQKPIVVNTTQEKPVVIHNLTIKVIDVYKTDEIKGSLGTKKIENNSLSYLVIKLEINNNRNYPLFVSNLDFYFIDNSGNKYYPEDYLDVENSLTMVNLRPYTSYTGLLIFKVPKNITEGYLIYELKNLKVSTSNLEGNIKETVKKSINTYKEVIKNYEIKIYIKDIKYKNL